MVLFIVILLHQWHHNLQMSSTKMVLTVKLSQMLFNTDKIILQLYQQLLRLMEMYLEAITLLSQDKISDLLLLL